MPISDDAELGEAAAEASRLIQQISNYLGERNSEAGKIAFPWGYIRRADEHRARLPFVRDEHLKHNLAYSLIYSDVLRWIINRTTLTGVARNMVIKANVCLCAVLVESITYDLVGGRRGGYKRRLDLLVAADAISEDLHRELSWLWGARASEHIFLADGRELDNYDVAASNRAVRAFRNLLDRLQDLGADVLEQLRATG